LGWSEISPCGRVKAASLAVGENCIAVTAKVSANPRELRHSDDPSEFLQLS